MLPSALPEPAVYALLVVLIVARLPAFGQRVLAFLRDLDDYRANRHKR